MGHERWAADSESGRDKNVDRYENVYRCRKHTRRRGIKRGEKKKRASTGRSEIAVEPCIQLPCWLSSIPPRGLLVDRVQVCVCEVSYDGPKT